MSQQSLPAADVPEMDDAMSVDAPLTQHASPARAPTATSSRGRGRGRWTRARSAKVTKPAQQRGAPAGRGRRQKVYDSLKVQAAHERAQELKQAFAAVGKLVKPAIQEIADRSINELLEDPDAHKKVPQYDAIQDFLRQRHEDTIRQCDESLREGMDMAKHVYEAECEKVHETFKIQLGELCEDRYGQLLQQLDILEFLYDNGLPVDLSALPDNRYILKSITEDEARWQGVFYQTQDGVEVPHSGKPISELMTKPQMPPLDATKRTADGQPESQPGPNAAHTAGLLGAAEAIEESAATTPDSGSNAATPPAAAAEPVEEPAPKPANQRLSSGLGTPVDASDLPIPRGATDPDEYGVRLISRRPTRLDVPNNRIMVPNHFKWMDYDIGFRDSTNCAQKGATKQRRGKYLGRPESNYLFLDRRVGIWDSTLAEGELDDELVEHFQLHPTLGIPIVGSKNKWAEPGPIVSGWKPVVFVAPSGERIHASRTIAAARVDDDTAEVEMKMRFAESTRRFCEQEGFSQEEVTPDQDEVARRRSEMFTAMLTARGMDPAQVARQNPAPVAPAAPEPVAEDTTAFAQFAEEALGAAASIEAEEEAARTAPAKRTRTSRPYDAIRDVFTEEPGAQQPSPPATAIPEAPAPSAVDTSALSCLADVVLESQPTAPEPVHYSQAPPNAGMRPAEYEQPQPEYRRPVEYQMAEPSRFARQDMAPAAAEPARTFNDFLRTALNTPPPVMTPVQQYSTIQAAPVSAPPPAPMSVQAPQAPTGRTPFSNTGTTKALPALRPMRNSLNEPAAVPDSQGNQTLHQTNMVASNSGAYFPPAANRPYHNGYSFQEPVYSTQHIMSQQPLGNPLQAPPLAGPPMGSAPARQMSPYSVSPPPYHQPVAPPPLGPAGPQAPMHLQGAPQGPTSASVQNTRSRRGSSSASSAPNPPAPGSSSKYRKLEPAPTPPHRLSYSGNGQELRTVPFDYREAIKDYSAVEAPPRTGPTQIRGWTHNNIKKPVVTARPPSSSSRGDVVAGASANFDEPSA
ncbi:uncharacterized protein B0T15DRAFT_496864 [Chaetomium strumarium]|uniref:Uncharacterized protein n=1 Tax=Chaetomium strumarium TaxID=1170767 RepID=A0AAJ0GLY2_9PEZI|nr:hypothetical protein B0T15DRAFT_496864 [Chaetomium strumarium]